VTKKEWSSVVPTFTFFIAKSKWERCWKGNLGLVQIKSETEHSEEGSKTMQSEQDLSYFIFR
jgi:hypothetical protein